MRPLRLILLFLALLLPAAWLPASAAPALWVVHGPRATIYLFGTVHVLKSGTRWHSPAFDKAFEESSELWLEVDISAEAAGIPALVQRLGFDRERPLSSRFPADQIVRLDAIARSVGVAEGAMTLDPMRPWLAAFAISSASMSGSGYGGAMGVESELEAIARTAGKSIHGLETAEQQIHVMADLPEALQDAMLRSTLDTLSKNSAMIDRLVAVWLKGEDAGLKDVRQMARQYPALYRTLIVRRNAGFADRIARMAKGSGTVMVAVGAAHFAGADSVQAMLAKRGIRAIRVQEAVH